MVDNYRTKARRVNQRDRLYVQREWIAWAAWVRDGQTFPNALGYGSSTPIGTLLSGEIGGGGQGKAKVPTWFSGDDNVEKANVVYGQMPEPTRVVLSGVYLCRMSEQRTADIINVSRRQVRNNLSTAYQALFDVLCGECTNTKSKGIVSD